jgi:hypothetical protein
VVSYGNGQVVLTSASRVSLMNVSMACAATTEVGPRADGVFVGFPPQAWVGKDG